MSKLISVVIPAYNEAERLPPTLADVCRFFQEKRFVFELLVVSDGSTDRTEAIVRSLSAQNTKIKLLVNAKNEGKGYSVRRGALAACGDYILFMDADSSTAIAELDAFWPHLSQYDVIIASRGLPDSRIDKHQFWAREATGKLFNFFIQLLFLPGIKDTQCGFKLFKREAAVRIFRQARTNRFVFDVEILCLARKMGYQILELPITWTNSKPSKVSFFKDFYNILSDLVRIKFTGL